MIFNEFDVNSQELINLLGSRLQAEFLENEKLRYSKEVEWIQDLRQCKGLYDPETLARIPATASRAYPKYTRAKEIILRARLDNILFPENDYNWDMEATPKPKISKKALDEIVNILSLLNQQKALEEAQTTGKPVPAKKVTSEQLHKAVFEYSSARCEKMKTEVRDQLIELKYDTIAKNTLFSGIRYGTGVVRGALSKKISEVGYEEGLNNDFTQIVIEKHLPDIEAIRIWDWYPDMAAMDLESCDFVWERFVMTKHQVRKLAKRNDFYGDVIYSYINEHLSGDATFKQWEIDLETLDENSTKRDKSKTGRFEVFSRWGFIDGNTLKAAGIEIDDENLNLEFMANIWIIGNRIIKLVLNPTAQDKLPYHIFYFDKDETSIFGTGLPKIIRDTQLIICGAIRATLNNAAKTSGTQIEVNIDLLSPDEDPEDVRPDRVWKRWGRNQDAQYPAVRPLNFDSNITELLMIYDKAVQLGDLEISIPMWMHSQPDRPSGKSTLGSEYLKIYSSAITLRDIVDSFDEMNESVLRSIYMWNMEFNPDNDIKGDYNVIVKGSVNLLTKELKMQSLTYFSQTLTDEERIYIKTGDFLKDRAKVFNLQPEDWMRTEEEAQAIRETMVDREAEAMLKAEKMADVRKKEAMARSLNAKADKTSKESDLEVIKTVTGE